MYKIILLMLVVLLSGCNSQTKDISARVKADKVLLNANIYTVNTEQPWVEAVAISKGVIVYAGSEDGVKEWVGNTTKIEDLGGRFLLPGFVDAHSHIFLGGVHMNDLILDRNEGINDWLQDLKKYDESNPEKEIIIGSGFLSSTFGADGPNKGMLDSVVADKPVFIMDDGMHGAWLNSAALAILNITSETPDISNFDYYKRNTNGEPTGYILEGTVWHSLKVLKAVTLEDVTAGTAEVIKLYNSYGITAVFDAGPWDAKEIQLDILEKLDKQGSLTIRFQGSQYIDDVADKDIIVDEVLRLKAESYGTRYPVDVLKIMVDGTVEGKTAAMFTAYQGEPENFGETVFTADELKILVNEAVSKKLDVHFHALGERAITETLDAIEFAKNNYPDTDSRFTVSNIQIMTDHDIERFSRMGVIAQSSLLWASNDVEGEKFLTASQFQRYYRYQSLLDTGATLTFGCDFPSHGGGLEGVSTLR